MLYHKHIRDMIGGTTKVKMVEGIPPLNLPKSNGKALKDYKTYGNSYQRLPQEYQEVEYIQNDGTAYIRTGVFPKDVDETELVLARTGSSSSQYYLGTRNAGSTAIGYSLYFTAHNGVYYYPLTWSGSGESVSLNTKFTTKTEFKNGTDKFYYNDTLTNTHTYNQVNYNSGEEIYLGAIRESSGSAGYISSAKYYSVIMRKNGVEVAHYVPCYRKSDTKIGMYDLVTGNFLYSAVSTQFTKGDDIVPTPDEPIEIESVGDLILPSEYQEVEYIEGDKLSYIKSGVTLDNDIKVYADFQVNSTDTTYGWCIFGARTSSAANQFDFRRFRLSGGNEQFSFRYGTNNYAVYTNLNDRNTVIFDRNKCYFKDNLVNTFISSSFSPAYEIYILATNQANVASNMADAKLYSLKIWKNDILIRDYIPCYRKSDGEVGLYDLVNNTFNINAGTGTFIKGQNKYNYVIPVKINNTTTNIYLNEPLRKIGDYADYIDFKNKKIIRNIKNEDLSNLTWSWQSAQNRWLTSSIRDYIRKTTDLLIIPTLSKYYKAYSYEEMGGSSYSEIIGICYYRSNGNIFIRNGSSTNKPEGELYYTLATPIEESITLPSILTAKDNCIIDVNTKVTPSNMLVKYITK